ncbi:MAG TPA: sugar-binding protein [Vicinamibacterales bacterium]|nr:sugar-binding protein [Vicinamibacterales bacterium]
MKTTVALVCMATAIMSGCARDRPSVRRLAFVTNNAADFWTIARKGTEQADAELAGATVEFRLGDGTAAEQKRIVDDLLAKGVDGIAISPVDPANQTGMLNDAARQTVVFTHDSDAPDSRRECYVGTDNVAAGREAGGLIKEALPQGGTIAVFVGKLDARNAQERLQGIKEAIAGSTISIIDVRTDDTDQVRAKANVSEMLVSHPDVAALVGLWSYNGPAILGAVRDAGRIGQVKIIAFDEDDETLTGVKSGAIMGTVVQQPYDFGYRSMTLLAKALDGDRSGIPASHQVFIPTQVIRQTNVEEFRTKLAKLRGR